MSILEMNASFLHALISALCEADHAFVTAMVNGDHVKIEQARETYETLVSARARVYDLLSVLPLISVNVQARESVPAPVKVSQAQADEWEEPVRRAISEEPARSETKVMANSVTGSDVSAEASTVVEAKRRGRPKSHESAAALSTVESEGEFTSVADYEPFYLRALARLGGKARIPNIQKLTFEIMQAEHEAMELDSHMVEGTDIPRYMVQTSDLRKILLKKDYIRTTPDNQVELTGRGVEEVEPILSDSDRAFMEAQTAKPQGAKRGPKPKDRSAEVAAPPVNIEGVKKRGRPKKEAVAA